MKVLRQTCMATIAAVCMASTQASAGPATGGYGAPAAAPASGGYGAPVAAAPVAPAATAQGDLIRKMSEILQTAPAESDWTIKAADLAKMIAEKKTDFLVVDVRPTPPGQQGGKIAGSLYIPYQEILKPENLAKLPKDKKLILACMTGQLQNLPVLALRTLGYQAYTLRYGHASWIKGYFATKFIQDGIAAANYPFEP